MRSRRCHRNLSHPVLAHVNRGHPRAGPPLHTSHRDDDPHGRQEAWQPSRRRPLVLFRSPARRQEPGCGSRQDQERSPRSEDGSRFRPHRHRRPPGTEYVEVHDEETAATAVDVLRRAVLCFNQRGLTTNGCRPTTGRPTVSSSHATCAPSWASRPSEPVRTGL